MMRIRPCIDIHNGKVKQIVGASLRDADTLHGQAGITAAAADPGVRDDNAAGGSAGTARENFVSARDADYYASIYRDKNLPGGHIILLNSAKEETAYAADRQQALKALAAYPGGMQIGGGITPRTAGAFLDAGASHVIVTSYVFRDGHLDMCRLEEMLRAVGREHLVLDLSCRRVCAPPRSGDPAPGPGMRRIGPGDAYSAQDRADLSGPQSPAEESPCYLVVTDRWQRFTDLEVCDETLERLSASCDEFLIHAADVEGRRAGIEEPLVSILGAWQRRRRRAGSTPFPVTYAGGVHAPGDITLLRTLAADTVDATVGSALDLFGGNLSLDELTRSAGGTDFS